MNHDRRMNAMLCAGLWVLSAFLSPVWAQKLAMPDTPSFQQVIANKDTLQELRKGGYVLYMRHGNTDSSKPDRVPNIDLNDCTTQRPLTPAGKATARKVGEFIRQSRIPLGDVFSSPLCRAKESAIAAFGEKMWVENDLMYTANLTSEEKKPIIAKTRFLISEIPAPNTNRVVVAHAPNLADVMGLFVTPEGTVVVIKPLGDGEFEYIASIPPTLWGDLLK